MPTQNHSHHIYVVFNALSDSDLLALRKAASLFIRGTSLYAEPSDLIHEALLRCLEGRRPWDGTIPFTLFLSNVMRSIAFADRNSFETRQFINASTFEESGAPDGLGWMAPRVQSAEEELIDQERFLMGRCELAKLKQHFKDDWLALELINAWSTGAQSPEIMETHTVSFNEFEAARRRLQRHIKKISPPTGATL